MTAKRFFTARAFSLLELLLALAILATAFAATTPYLFGTREKASLINDRDKLIKTLEFAQQQSISAHEGYAYSVGIVPPKTYIYQPDNIFHTLSKSINITQPLVLTHIEFAKLTGKPYSPLQITLTSKRFETSIIINMEGTITTSPPTRI